MGVNTDVRSINRPLEKKLNRRALGISNVIKNPENQKIYSVQFYDYDIPDALYFNTPREPDLSKVIDDILEIFLYDCIGYRTRDGIHFISFALTFGRRLTRARAIELSHKLVEQDYWTLRKDLCLRVSAKRSLRLYSNKSPKPTFFKVLKEPVRSDLRISGGHLEFYEMYMSLPKEVSELYADAHIYNFPIRTYSYMTRD